MFLHLSVILFRGGLGESLSRDGLCLGGLCPSGGLCSGESLSKGWSLSRGVSVQGESPVQGWSLSRGVSVMGPPPKSGRAGGTNPTGMHSCLSLISFCY